MAAVDVKTRAVQKYLLVGQRVWHAGFTPDDRFLLTANGISNDVSIIDVAAMKVVKSVQVGQSPWDLVIVDTMK
jgi:YVTN family beta-propeller protein